MRSYLLQDRWYHSAKRDDAGVSVVVVFLVALMATLAVRYLNLPLDAAFLGLPG